MSTGSWAEAAAAPRPPDALGALLPTFPLDWGAGSGRLRTALPDFRCAVAQMSFVPSHWAVGLSF